MSKADYYSEANHGPHEIFELGDYEWKKPRLDMATGAHEGGGGRM